MKISLMPRVEDININDIAGSSAVVIDMLRATSVIVTALYNGAEHVVPVLTTDEAKNAIYRFRNAVLGGERKGLKIEGFDAGNSPLEYTREFIQGRTLIITTSNGTRAINNCNEAKNIYIGSMLNGKAAALKAVENGTDISIVCAGTQGRFSLDDFTCAGLIIDEILKMKDYELSDISFLARHTYTQNEENIEGFIKNASHYKYLCSIGQGEDIKYCCSRNIIDIVPTCKEGIISIG